MQGVTTMDSSNDGMIVKSLSVPIGLEELMESLTKEVLLKRPADIYSFAYHHFEKLLGLREKGSYKGQPNLKGAKTVIKRGTRNEAALKKANTVPEKSIKRQIPVKRESISDSLYLVGSNKTLTLKNVQKQGESETKSKQGMAKQVLERRRSKKLLERNISLEESRKQRDSLKVQRNLSMEERRSQVVNAKFAVGKKTPKSPNNLQDSTETLKQRSKKIGQVTVTNEKETKTVKEKEGQLMKPGLIKSESKITNFSDSSLNSKATDSVDVKPFRTDHIQGSDDTISHESSQSENIHVISDASGTGSLVQEDLVKNIEHTDSNASSVNTDKIQKVQPAVTKICGSDILNKNASEVCIVTPNNQLKLEVEVFKPRENADDEQLNHTNEGRYTDAANVTENTLKEDIKAFDKTDTLLDESSELGKTLSSQSNQVENKNYLEENSAAKISYNVVSENIVTKNKDKDLKTAEVQKLEAKEFNGTEESCNVSGEMDAIVNSTSKISGAEDGIANNKLLESVATVAESSFPSNEVPKVKNGNEATEFHKEKVLDSDRKEYDENDDKTVIQKLGSVEVEDIKGEGREKIEKEKEINATSIKTSETRETSLNVDKNVETPVQLDYPEHENQSHVNKDYVNVQNEDMSRNIAKGDIEGNKSNLDRKLPDEEIQHTSAENDSSGVRNEVLATDVTVVNETAKGAENELKETEDIELKVANEQRSNLVKTDLYNEDVPEQSNLHQELPMVNNIAHDSQAEAETKLQELSVSEKNRHVGKAAETETQIDVRNESLEEVQKEFAEKSSENESFKENAATSIKHDMVPDRSAESLDKNIEKDKVNTLAIGSSVSEKPVHIENEHENENLIVRTYVNEKHLKDEDDATLQKQEKQVYGKDQLVKRDDNRPLEVLAENKIQRPTVNHSLKQESSAVDLSANSTAENEENKDKDFTDMKTQQSGKRNIDKNKAALDLKKTKDATSNEHDKQESRSVKKDKIISPAKNDVDAGIAARNVQSSVTNSGETKPDIALDENQNSVLENHLGESVVVLVSKEENLRNECTPTVAPSCLKNDVKAVISSREHLLTSGIVPQALKDADDINVARNTSGPGGPETKIIKQNSLNSDPKETVSYDPSSLRRELNAVQQEKNLSSFKTSYNPYILRNEIRSVSAESNDAKQSINNTKKPMNLLDKAAAALKIQAIWKGYRVRKERKVKGNFLGQKSVINEDSFKKKAQAVLKIQSSWRGHRVRKDLKGVEKEIEKLKHQEDEIATKIQAEDENNGKSKTTPPEENEAKKLETVESKRDKAQHDAAVKIQAGIRGYLVRKNILRKQVVAALAIQKFWKRYKDNLEKKKQKYEQSEVKIGTEGENVEYSGNDAKRKEKLALSTTGLLHSSEIHDTVIPEIKANKEDVVDLSLINDFISHEKHSAQIREGFQTILLHDSADTSQEVPEGTVDELVTNIHEIVEKELEFGGTAGTKDCEQRNQEFSMTSSHINGENKKIEGAVAKISSSGSAVENDKDNEMVTTEEVSGEGEEPSQKPLGDKQVVEASVEHAENINSSEEHNKNIGEIVKEEPNVELPSNAFENKESASEKLNDIASGENDNSIKKPTEPIKEAESGYSEESSISSVERTTEEHNTCGSRSDKDNHKTDEVVSKVQGTDSKSEQNKREVIASVETSNDSKFKLNINAEERLEDALGVESSVTNVRNITSHEEQDHNLVALNEKHLVNKMGNTKLITADISNSVENKGIISVTGNSNEIDGVSKSKKLTVPTKGTDSSNAENDNKLNTQLKNQELSISDNGIKQKNDDFEEIVPKIQTSGFKLEEAEQEMVASDEANSGSKCQGNVYPEIDLKDSKIVGSAMHDKNINNTKEQNKKIEERKGDRSEEKVEKSESAASEKVPSGLENEVTVVEKISSTVSGESVNSDGVTNENKNAVKNITKVEPTIEGTETLETVEERSESYSQGTQDPSSKMDKDSIKLTLQDNLTTKAKEEDEQQASNTDSIVSSELENLSQVQSVNDTNLSNVNEDSRTKYERLTSHDEREDKSTVDMNDTFPDEHTEDSEKSKANADITLDFDRVEQVSTDQPAHETVDQLNVINDATNHVNSSLKEDDKIKTKLNEYTSKHPLDKINDARTNKTEEFAKKVPDQNHTELIKTSDANAKTKDSSPPKVQHDKEPSVSNDVDVAAAKIQAGIRGYLVRKEQSTLRKADGQDDKTAAPTSELNQVKLEECEKQIITDSDEERERLSQKLSDDVIREALKALDKVVVPPNSPSKSREKRDVDEDKPGLHRSATVTEEEIQKVHIPPLGRSQSAEAEFFESRLRRLRSKSDLEVITEDTTGISKEGAIVENRGLANINDQKSEKLEVTKQDASFDMSKLRAEIEAASTGTGITSAVENVSVECENGEKNTMPLTSKVSLDQKVLQEPANMNVSSKFQKESVGLVHTSELHDSVIPVENEHLEGISKKSDISKELLEDISNTNEFLINEKQVAQIKEGFRLVPLHDLNDSSNKVNQSQLEGNENIIKGDKNDGNSEISTENEHVNESEVSTMTLNVSPETGKNVKAFSNTDYDHLNLSSHKIVASSTSSTISNTESNDLSAINTKNPSQERLAAFTESLSSDNISVLKKDLSQKNIDLPTKTKQAPAGAKIDEADSSEVTDSSKLNSTWSEAVNNTENFNSKSSKSSKDTEGRTTAKVTTESNETQNDKLSDNLKPEASYSESLAAEQKDLITEHSVIVNINTDGGMANKESLDISNEKNQDQKLTDGTNGTKFLTEDAKVIFGSEMEEEHRLPKEPALPDYESAPTRPVTSDFRIIPVADENNSSVNLDKQSPEHEARHEIAFNDTKRPLSIDSTTSNDSVVTVIHNDTSNKTASSEITKLSETPEEVPQQNVDMAATKIQSVYRGHRVRRDLKREDSIVSVNAKDELKDFGVKLKEDIPKKLVVELPTTGVKELEDTDRKTSSQDMDKEETSSLQGLVESEGLYETGQQNEPPAGAQVLTSRPPATPTAVTHASIKDGFAAANGQPAPNAASSRGRMEEKRINANFVKKDLEAEAATKIQAGFRGYKVRKQLKLKKNSGSIINNQNRIARRKSSTRTKNNSKINQHTPTELEQRMATKIQAGIRGYLVRKRQKNVNKKQVAQAS